VSELYTDIYSAMYIDGMSWSDPHIAPLESAEWSNPWSKPSNVMVALLPYEGSSECQFFPPSRFPKDDHSVPRNAVIFSRSSYRSVQSQPYSLNSASSLSFAANASLIFSASRWSSALLSNFARSASLWGSLALLGVLPVAAGLGMYDGLGAVTYLGPGDGPDLKLGSRDASSEACCAGLRIDLIEDKRFEL